MFFFQSLIVVSVLSVHISDSHVPPRDGIFFQCCFFSLVWQSALLIRDGIGHIFARENPNACDIAKIRRVFVYATNHDPVISSSLSNDGGRANTIPSPKNNNEGISSLRPLQHVENNKFRGIFCFCVQVGILLDGDGAVSSLAWDLVLLLFPVRRSRKRFQYPPLLSLYCSDPQLNATYFTAN